ncbi:MAG: hypothetical protein FWD23_16130 [Oscillospiraceae bacterium]|nr:hypothetical protein [Oscillospiraceae bacterium]
MSDYYEKFYIQQWLPKPGGFDGEIFGWSDGAEIRGLFIQDTSKEMRIAEAQGVNSLGTFATDINAAIKEGDVIRRESDNAYFRITGVSVKSPVPAMVQIQRMNAERTEVGK